MYTQQVLEKPYISIVQIQSNFSLDEQTLSSTFETHVISFLQAVTIKMVSLVLVLRQCKPQGLHLTNCMEYQNFCLRSWHEQQTAYFNLFYM